MNYRKLTSILVVLFFCAQLPAQKLSKVERKLVKTIEANNNEAIDFLEFVVNINSGTLNAKGVKEVGMVFKDAFENIDFETTWIEMPEEMNRAGHLFAQTEGNKGKKLLLIGHIDTVFEENSPFQEFERVNDSIAHAPGGNDMKGGDVIVLYALKALHVNGLLNDAQIMVAFTGDEESTGKPLDISRKDLIEAAKRSDIALGMHFMKRFAAPNILRLTPEY